MTVDGRQSLILTFNPTTENLCYTRDFGIAVRAQRLTAEIDRLFDADWSDGEFTPGADSPFLVSPHNSRVKMLGVLGSAKRSIHVSDAKVEDPEAILLLESKAASEVEVRILGDEGHSLGSRSSLVFRPMTVFFLYPRRTSDELCGDYRGMLLWTYRPRSRAKVIMAFRSIS